jgi:hypothetical protein
VLLKRNQTSTISCSLYFIPFEFFGNTRQMIFKKRFYFQFLKLLLQRFSTHFLNFLTKMRNPKLMVIIPVAINPKLSPAWLKPQAITKEPANTKIVMKTQVSKGNPIVLLGDLIYKTWHKMTSEAKSTTYKQYYFVRA